MPVLGFLSEKSRDDLAVAVPDDIHDVNIVLVQIEINACLKHQGNGLSQGERGSIVFIGDG